MKTTPVEYAGTYKGMALIADPIYRYASFTVPAADRGEKTEKDLIDSPGCSVSGGSTSSRAPAGSTRRPSIPGFSIPWERCTWRASSAAIFTRR
jgi:hypothetical protein